MIAAGFGFRAAATVESLRDALAAAGPARPDMLATAGDKAGSLVFLAFAGEMALPVRSVTAATLARQETETHSAASRATHGTGSVAEAAALAAAGPGARLLGPRVVSKDRMATCALAEGDER